MSRDIELRNAQREAFCQGCDMSIIPGERMLSTYSMRNRGQNIFFCIGCSEEIKRLLNEEGRV